LWLNKNIPFLTKLQGGLLLPPRSLLKATVSSGEGREGTEAANAVNVEHGPLFCEWHHGVVLSPSNYTHHRIFPPLLSSQPLKQVWPEVYLVFALETAYGDTMADAFDIAFVIHTTGVENVHPFPPSVGDAYSWIKPDDAALKSLALRQQRSQQSQF
jgi:hypothetical protein